MKSIFRNLLSAVAIAAAALVAAPAASAQVPATHLRTVEGKTIDTGDITNGNTQPVIFTFFATWCKPCMREMAALADRIDELEDAGVRVVAVSIDEAQDEEKVKALANSKGWPWEVVLDPTGEVRRGMGVQTVPHAFVVAPDGAIVLNHPGYQDGSESELIEAAVKAAAK